MLSLTDHHLYFLTYITCKSLSRRHFFLTVVGVVH